MGIAVLCVLGPLGDDAVWRRRVRGITAVEVGSDMDDRVGAVRAGEKSGDEMVTLCASPSSNWSLQYLYSIVSLRVLCSRDLSSVRSAVLDLTLHPSPPESDTLAWLSYGPRFSSSSPLQSPRSSVCAHNRAAWKKGGIVQVRWTIQSGQGQIDRSSPKKGSRADPFQGSSLS